MAQAQKEFLVVGKRISRIDGYERVTGQAQYTGDIQLPGMLYARVLRSSVPHAKIVSIDTSKAEKLPGVKAVVHHQNAQIPWSSGGHTHRRFNFNNPVRYVGDAVAAVAATDRHIAEEALALIEVKYEKLPHVLDPNDALKPDAPKIGPDGNLSVGKGAFSAPIEETWGNLESGFKEADRVFEDTYITKHVNNAQMERRVSVAKWDAGKLTVYASTQAIFASAASARIALAASGTVRQAMLASNRSGTSAPTALATARTAATSSRNSRPTFSLIAWNPAAIPAAASSAISWGLFW